MFTCNFRPYEGEQPYIFISYAHKDSETVYPIIERLNKDGYRVWFDDGITPGTEWPEYIATRIDHCSVFIFFASPNSVGSENCRREVNFVLNRKKSFFTITIEPTTLSLGLEMQISTQQNITLYDYADEEKFYDTLYDTPFLASCKNDGTPEPKAEPVKIESVAASVREEASDISVPETNTESIPSNDSSPVLPGSQTKSEKKHIIPVVCIGIGGLILAAIVFAIVWNLNKPKEKQPEDTLIIIDQMNSYDIMESHLYLENAYIDQDVISNLNQMKQVNSVTFSKCNFSENADLNVLDFWGNVDYLSIEKTEIPNYSFLKKMSSLATLSITDVQTFSVENCSYIPSEEPLSITLDSIAALDVSDGFQYQTPDGWCDLTITNCKMNSFTLNVPIDSLTLTDCSLSELKLNPNVSSWYNLTALKLDNNQLQDVSFLSSLYDSLSDLSLSGNPIDRSSLTFIMNCTELTSLNLSYIPLEDLSVISEMPYLLNLQLSHCGINSLDNGSQDNSLYNVDLSYNNISSLKGLDSLLSADVNCLNISHNQCTHIEELPALSYEILVIYGNSFDFQDTNASAFLSDLDVSSLITDYKKGLENITFKDSLQKLRLSSEDTSLVDSFKNNPDLYITTNPENELDELLLGDFYFY